MLKPDERYRVLYVDDDDSLLKLAEMYFRREPEITLLMANSVEDAFKIMESDRVDVIISDNEMGSTNGIEFLKKIKSNPSFQKIPFILFTARERREIFLEAYENKADFYHQKGTDPKPQYTELISKVKMVYKKNRFEKMMLGIYDFTNKVVEEKDLKENLEFILANIVDIFHVNASHISLIRDNTIQYYVSSGEMSEGLKNVKLSLIHGLGGLIVEKGKSHAINDYCHDEIIKHPPDDVPAKDGIITCAAAPIRFGSRIYGILYVHRYFQKNFSEKDLRTLSLYANIIAMALESSNAKKKNED